MYETLEHWKQYKQKKYPTMNELLEMGYTKPGAMVLDEMIEAEEQAKELFNECGFQYKKEAYKRVDELLTKLSNKNGVTKY